MEDFTFSFPHCAFVLFSDLCTQTEFLFYHYYLFVVLFQSNQFRRKKKDCEGKNEIDRVLVKNENVKLFIRQTKHTKTTMTEERKKVAHKSK